MEAISLPTLVQEHLTIARTASNGRSAHTVFGGHDHRLRQTLIALAAGQELAEHESPGEATIHVLAGAGGSDDHDGLRPCWPLETSP